MELLEIWLLCRSFRWAKRRFLLISSLGTLACFFKLMRAVISTLLLSSVDSTGIEGSTVTLVRHTEIHTPIYLLVVRLATWGNPKELVGKGARGKAW